MPSLGAQTFFWPAPKAILGKENYRQPCQQVATIDKSTTILIADKYLSLSVTRVLDYMITTNRLKGLAFLLSNSL